MDTNILSITQVKKLKHREDKDLAQIHKGVRVGMCVPGICLQRPHSLHYTIQPFYLPGLGTLPTLQAGRLRLSNFLKLTHVTSTAWIWNLHKWSDCTRGA